MRVFGCWSNRNRNRHEETPKNRNRHELWSRGGHGIVTAVRAPSRIAWGRRNLILQEEQQAQRREHHRREDDPHRGTSQFSAGRKLRNLAHDKLQIALYRSEVSARLTNLLQREGVFIWHNT